MNPIPVIPRTHPPGRHGARRVALALWLTVAAATTATTATPEPTAPTAPETLGQELARLRLDVAGGRRVQDLVLSNNASQLRLIEGTLFPAITGDGTTVELVFLGRGRVEMTPPDEVEAGQLQLFTGSSRLAEGFSEAVLVVARDAAAAALLDRETADPDPAQTSRAEELYESWRHGPERRALDVESGIFLDLMGEGAYEDYFAAWFRGDELGDFLLLVDPGDREQVTLGQFVAASLSDKEKRRAAKLIHAEQRRGRQLSLRVQDLGTWDTWMSFPLTRLDGTRAPASAAFEPTHYTLEVTADPGEGTLGGIARVGVRAATGGRRVVPFQLPADLAVSGVRDADGQDLPFRRTSTEVLAVLPRAPEPGATLELEIAYGGTFFEDGGDRNWALADGVFWHPHLGVLDRATYDVTLRYPKKLDLMAAGRRVDGGEEGDLRWERRRLDVPTWAFGWELGRYKVHSAQIGKGGHVALTLAFDRGMVDRSKAGLEEVAAALDDALAFYEEVFGPYPADELSVVTVPRGYSQSLFGFVTFSNLMLVDWGGVGLEGLGALFGFADRRAVIAHEVAHQWWGHQLGFNSYRDQWISEAMANYAALAWTRHRLSAAERPRVGPTFGWQTELTASLADGRPVESLGPLVLGSRLDSSKGAGYSPIAYRKGAVVVDMLANAFGEDNFLSMCRQLFTHLSGRDLTTADLLAAFGRLSGSDLSAFGDQFVYGTGLPEVFYDYRIEPRAEGGSKVWVEAQQEVPWRFAHRVVERDGQLDVARRRLDQTDGAKTMLVVPIQIVLAVGGDDDSERFLAGRLPLEGEHTEVAIDVAEVAERVWLDREGRVFGRFYNRRRQPKRVLLSQGVARLAAGETAAAQQLLEQALSTSTPTEGLEKDAQKDFEAMDRILDGRVQIQLARLALDRGDLDLAEQHLDAARRFVRGRDRWWIDAPLTVQEARLAHLRGDPEAAFKMLRKGILRRGEVDSTEAFLLLAITARATDHPDDFTIALAAARARGADVSRLETGPAEAGGSR